VIVNVTVTGALVVLTGVPGILPVPFDAMPVTATVLSLDQVYTVPATLPVSTIVVIGLAEHTVCDAGVATAFGTGFTTTVAVTGVPGQLLADGVMVKVTVTGAKLVLVSEPGIGDPEPLAGIPVTVTVLSLTHVYVVAATVPVSTTGVIDDPEQIVCVDGVAVTSGVGFTSTVAVIIGPLQVVPALV
jgi:hypothetical protein